MGPGDVLERLLHLPSEDQRDRLVTIAESGNWWLGVIQFATSRATLPEPGEGERREWARLAAVTLDAAQDTGGLAAREVVTRRASLSFVLSKYGKPQDFHPSLHPDRAARQCLEAVGSTPSEAGATSWSLRAEDVPVMRKLRRIRNLVSPAVQLSELVEDDELRAELAAWREVLPRLP